MYYLQWCKLLSRSQGRRRKNHRAVETATASSELGQLGQLGRLEVTIHSPWRAQREWLRRRCLKVRLIWLRLSGLSYLGRTEALHLLFVFHFLIIITWLVFIKSTYSILFLGLSLLPSFPLLWFQLLLIVRWHTEILALGALSPSWNHLLLSISKAKRSL